MIRLAIIEDDEGIRNTLRDYLQTSLEFEVPRVYESAEDFMHSIPVWEADAKPFIILLDINLPGMSGIAAIPLIKHVFPDVDIIMNSVLQDSESIFQSLCAGAIGYINKETPLEKIRESLVTVSKGGSPMTPSIARKVVEYFNPQKRFTEDMTTRETEIANGIVEGLSYKLIAARFDISIDTVRKHIRKIYRKLHINSKGELIARYHSGELNKPGSNNASHSS